MIDLENMDDDEFVDYCLEIAVKQGRVKRTGTLRRIDPENAESPYAEDVIYSVVLS